MKFREKTPVTGVVVASAFYVLPCQDSKFKMNVSYGMQMSVCAVKIR